MRRLLFVIAVLAMFACAAGLLLCGCDEGGTTAPGGETTTEKTVEKTPTRPADEQLLYDYFGAIDEGRYRDAFDMRTASLEPDADFEEFSASYRDYVKSVKVVSVKKLPEFSEPGREEFQVTLDATYIKPYPAGSGQIPMFYILVPDPEHQGGWLIESEGTGP